VKCIFQIIEPTTGRRTASVECTREEFLDGLVAEDDSVFPDDFGDHLVLVVAELIEDVWCVARVPLMKVDTFKQKFLQMECA